MTETPEHAPAAPAPDTRTSIEKYSERSTAHRSPLYDGLEKVDDAVLRSRMAEARHEARGNLLAVNTHSVNDVEKTADKLKVRITEIALEYRSEADAWMFLDAVAPDSPAPDADGKNLYLHRTQEAVLSAHARRPVNFRPRGRIAWIRGGAPTARRSLRSRNRKADLQTAEGLTAFQSMAMRANLARHDDVLLDGMRRWPKPCTQIARAGERAEMKTWDREKERADREHAVYAKKVRLAIYGDDLMPTAGRDLADHRARMYHRARQAADDARDAARSRKAREIALREPNLYADEIRRAVDAGDETLAAALRTIPKLTDEMTAAVGSPDSSDTEPDPEASTPEQMESDLLADRPVPAVPVPAPRPSPAPVPVGAPDSEPDAAPVPAGAPDSEPDAAPDPLDSDDEWIRKEARRQQIVRFANDSGIETHRDDDGRVRVGPAPEPDADRDSDTEPKPTLAEKLDLREPAAPRFQMTFAF